MKFTPSSTARRNTRMASSWSRGSPQMPGPVRRIAPKPSRTTGMSPPMRNVPLSSAGGVILSVVMTSPSHEDGTGRLRADYGGAAGADLDPPRPD